MRKAQERLSGCSQRDPAVIPQQQRFADFLLQPLNNATEGRGTHMHRLGGAAKMQRRRQMTEQFQFLQVHGSKFCFKN
jgi:hypothetical protein